MISPVYIDAYTLVIDKHVIFALSVMVSEVCAKPVLDALVPSAKLFKALCLPLWLCILVLFIASVTYSLSGDNENFSEIDRRSSFDRTHLTGASCLLLRERVKGQVHFAAAVVLNCHHY